jgi:hypothetical protein
MDKFNGLDLQDYVKLEDILATTFLQVADLNLLGRSLRTQTNTCSSHVFARLLSYRNP